MNNLVPLDHLEALELQLFPKLPDNELGRDLRAVVLEAITARKAAWPSIKAQIEEELARQKVNLGDEMSDGDDGSQHEWGTGCCAGLEFVLALLQEGRANA